MLKLPEKGKTLVINDLHIPDHDKKAINLVFKLMKDYRPDNIIINGDLVDCYRLSRYPKSPPSGIDFTEEIKQTKAFLTKLRSAQPRAKIVYLEGNHEFRLKAYLINQAPALYGISELTWEKLLDLKKHRITWIGSGYESQWQDTFIQVGEVFVGHFKKASSNSAATAKSLVESKGASIVQGHCHRVGAYYKRLITGQVLTGYENGCLCDLDPSYMKRPNWQQAVTTIHNGIMTLHRIEEYSLAWGGKVLK